MSLVSSIFKSRASSKANKAIKETAARSDATQRYIYDDIVERNQYREDIGNAAIGKLAGMYGIGDQAPKNQSQQPQTQGQGMFNFGRGFNPQPMSQPYGMSNPDQRSRITSNGFSFAKPSNPYMQTGQSNQPQMQNAPGMPDKTPQGGNPAAFTDFYNSPDYQLAFNEGQSAIEGGAAARGGLLSGNTAKAVTQFGQDTASNTFGNYRNSLNSLAGTGQVAGNASSAAGQNYANSYTQNQTMVGQSRANNAMNQGNIWGGFGGSIANGLMGGFG